MITKFSDYVNALTYLTKRRANDLPYKEVKSIIFIFKVKGIIFIFKN